jgi:heme/copper-type cytochrome/quinol oxidase subunit 1
MSEKEVVGRRIFIALEIVCIILLACLVGATSLFQSQINDKDNTISTLKTTNINLQNQVNVFTEILNLAKKDVWVNGQTVSQSANSYTGWTFEADTAGYVAVTVLTTATNDTYVRVL